MPFKKMLIKYYIILNLIGVALWVSGFFMAAGLVYPFAFIGIYLGPPVLLLGIIGWILNYKVKNNILPNPIKTYAKTSKKYTGIFRKHMTMFDFLFSHILEFWTFCVVFWIALAFIGTSLMKNSDAFKTSIKYAERDTELKKIIGGIKYYGFLAGGSFSSDGSGKLTFSIIGERGIVNANSIVEEISGQSQVTKIEYE